MKTAILTEEQLRFSRMTTDELGELRNIIKPSEMAKRTKATTDKKLLLYWDERYRLYKAIMDGKDADRNWLMMEQLDDVQYRIRVYQEEIGHKPLELLPVNYERKYPSAFNL